MKRLIVSCVTAITIAIAAVATGQQIPDQIPKKAQFAFSEGYWMPHVDPARIGAENFKTQINLRPVQDGLRAVRGYSKINSTALAYPYVRNGVQMRKDDTSFNLVHAQDASGNGKIYLNRTDPPGAGDFETTAIYDDPSQNLTTYFSELPGGGVGWANEEQSIIYSGDTMRLAGAFTVDDAALTNPVDRLKAANSDLATSDDILEIDGPAGQRFLIIFTTRKLDALNVEISTANTDTATTPVTVKCFGGTSFDAVTTLVDNTAVGSVPLKQSGTITFDSTVDTAVPYNFEGLYAWAYLLEWPATADAEISHISGRAPPQPLNNVWDGAFRNTIQAQVVETSTNENEEYTLEVNEPSTTEYPIGMQLDGLPTTKHIFLQYEERMSALKFTMLGGYINKLARTMVLEYWHRSTGWTAVTNLVDGTADGGKPLAKSGQVTWTPPDPRDEVPKTDFGGTGYCYRMSFTGGSLTGTAGGTPEVMVDILYAIPAQEKVSSFNFLGVFKGRVLGCGVSSENEGNRVDFSLTNAPDVWNGEETSRDTMQSLYFGSDNEPLTAGMALYNRYASTVKEFFVTFKKTKTYQLRGSGPEDWEIDTVSDVIGCPAPKTLIAVDGFELGDKTMRRVLLWIDYSQPKLYDGANIMSLGGIDNFFDPGDPDCINYEYIHTSIGWFDPTYSEWNIVIPSGETATAPNKWLVFNTERKRWFEKDTGQSPALRCGWLMRDDNGIRYPVGGTDTGHVMLLETSGTWDGADIDQTVETGDWWPTDSVWERTQIKALKFMARRLDEAGATVDIIYFKDTDPADATVHQWIDSAYHSFIDREDGSHKFISGSLFSLDISTGTKRIVRATTVTNLQAWSHGFGFKISTNTDEANLYIGWGAKYAFLRDDN